MSVQWTDPSWRGEAEEWIRAAISGLGYALVGPIEHSHMRPWGTVARVPTDNGLLWFKANVDPLAFELRLIELLAAQAVPQLLAREPSRGWMLMADAGPLVSDLYGEEPPLDVWKEFLRAHARLQVAAAPAADELIAAGVPDRRLPNLLESLERVLDNDRMVRPPTPDALTPGELGRVHALMPKLQQSVAVLTVLGLPDSVQHDDLHPWNVCVDGDDYRFIDWGDACVSQPFLTLAVTLRFAASRAGLPEDAPAILALRDAYLEPWTAEAAAEDLRAAAALGRRLGELSRTLSWRVVASTYPGVVDHYPGGFAGSLRRVLRHFA